MSLKLEKDVPQPAGRKAQYPFAEMAVGHSFFAPTGPKQNAQRQRQMIAKAAYQWRMTSACTATVWQFTAAVVNEGGQVGVRFWRVE